MRASLFLTVAAVWAATAAVASARDHSHLVQFRRQSASSSKYPAALKTPPRSSLPQAWVDALEALQNAGKVPDIPQSNATADGVKYPKGVANDPKTCSWSVTKCEGANDIYNGTAGMWTVGFDDGPTAVSTGLYDFLHSHNQPATHYMIGSQILAYMDAAKHAVATQQQLGVHTWSHSLQTTKDNYEVLGELGWTMQIIYDISGRVPKYWRPPQGDIDNRVRAIAEGVFNLTAVMWDAECNDWCIGDNGKTACPGENPGETQKSVRKAIQKALKMPKSDGVILLEHELNKYTVGFFEEYYPKLQSLGWKPTSIPEQLGVDWYHNAANNDDTPVKVNSMVYSDVADAMSKSNGASSNKAAVKNSSSSSSGSPSSSTSMNANATKGTSGAAKVTIASAGVAALAGTLACLLALV